MPKLSFREIIRFYAPLLLTSQMMTLSGPIINVAVGRAADPKLDFASYWIGFAVLLFLESPCLVTQQVTATLVDGYWSIRRLMTVSLVVGFGASLTALLVACTPLGDLVFLDFIHTTARVAERATNVLIILSPVPVIIAVRGIATGIAIKEKQTGMIARATIGRIVVLASIAGIAVAIGTGSGAYAGATALLSGLIVETLMVFRSAAPELKRRLAIREPEGERLTYGEIIRIGAPVSLSAYVWTVSRPVVNAILGRLPDPELAQAGFGVVTPLVLLTCSPLWAIQNVTLILPESRADLRRAIRFGVALMITFSIIIIVMAATPVRDFLLHGVFNLAPDLEREVAPALFLIVFEPFFLGARSLSQGLLMRARKTTIIGVSSLIKLIVVTSAGIYLAMRNPGIQGTVLGTALFIGGDFIDATLFGIRARLLVLKGDLFKEESVYEVDETTLAEG